MDLHTTTSATEEDGVKLRREDRVRSRGVVSLFVDGQPPVTARIYDVSPNGMSVDVNTEITPQSFVRIEGLGIVGHAIVRRCTAFDNTFRIGMELIPPPGR